MEIKVQESISCKLYGEEVDQSKTTGSWTFDENLLYVLFLQKNKVIMQSKRKRRNQRIFDQMSQFIGSRTSLQCRSHHQKFLEKLGDVKTIITNFKKFISKEDFRARYLETQGKKKVKQGLREEVKEEILNEDGEQQEEEMPREPQDEAEMVQEEQKQKKGQKEGSSTSNSQHQKQESQPINKGFQVATPQFHQNPFILLNNQSLNLQLLSLLYQNLYYSF